MLQRGHRRHAQAGLHGDGGLRRHEQAVGHVATVGRSRRRRSITTARRPRALARRTCRARRPGRCRRRSRISAIMNRLSSRRGAVGQHAARADTSGALARRRHAARAGMPRGEAGISAIMAKRKTVITAWRPVVQAARASLGSRAAWPRSGGQHAGRDQPEPACSSGDQAGRSARGDTADGRQGGSPFRNQARQRQRDQRGIGQHAARGRGEGAAVRPAVQQIAQRDQRP